MVCWRRGLLEIREIHIHNHCLSSPVYKNRDDSILLTPYPHQFHFKYRTSQALTRSICCHFFFISSFITRVGFDIWLSSDACNIGPYAFLRFTHRFPSLTSLFSGLTNGSSRSITLCCESQIRRLWSFRGIRIFNQSFSFARFRKLLRQKTTFAVFFFNLSGGQL